MKFNAELVRRIVYLQVVELKGAAEIAETLQSEGLDVSLAQIKTLTPERILELALDTEEREEIKEFFLDSIHKIKEHFDRAVEQVDLKIEEIKSFNDPKRDLDLLSYIREKRELLSLSMKAQGMLATKVTFQQAESDPRDKVKHTETIIQRLVDEDQIKILNPLLEKRFPRRKKAV